MTAGSDTARQQTPVITFSEFFQYRNVWMLAAIIWVFFFHASFPLPGVLNYIKRVGYGGVDIFLFASGIGCYFSLKRDGDTGRFYKKRLQKILPMWFTFLLFWLPCQFLQAPMTLSEVLGNITGLGFFAGTGRQFNWYIGAMVATYLLAPILTDLLPRIKKPGAFVLTILLLCLGTFVFFKKGQLILWTRLPIFCMGIYTAALSTRKQDLTKKKVWLTLLCMLAGMALTGICIRYFKAHLWAYGLWWYPLILVTPGLCLTVSLVCRALCRTPLKKLIDLCTLLGGHTFSLYLCHIAVFDLVGKYSPKVPFLQQNFVAVCLIAPFVCAVLLTGLTRLTQRLYHRLFGKI